MQPQSNPYKKRRNAITNVVDFKDLKNSMEFEICRLIKLETKALTFDFESGENYINIPFFWWIITFQCKSLNEFLQFKLYDYLSALEKSYIKKKGFLIKN